MKIILNGDLTDVVGATTVADLLGGDRGGRAVAVNGVVVRRAEHATTELADGDVVEVVTAVQGG